MNITKQLEATERFDFEYKGEKLWFEARKESLTPRFLDQTTRITDYPAAINETITSWSLTSDDAGTMWPLDVESVSRIPVDFLQAILGKIAESWAGDEKKQQDSASGLAAAAS